MFWFTTTVLCACTWSLAGGKQASRPAAPVEDVCVLYGMILRVPGTFRSLDVIGSVCVCQSLFNSSLKDISSYVRVEKGRQKELLTKIPCNASLQCQKNVPLSLCVAIKTGNMIINVFLCNRTTNVSMSGMRCVRFTRLLAGEGSAYDTGRDCQGLVLCILGKPSFAKRAMLVRKDIGRCIQNERSYDRMKHLTAIDESESIPDRLLGKQAESFAAGNAPEFLQEGKARIKGWKEKRMEQLFRTQNKTKVVQTMEVREDDLAVKYNTESIPNNPQTSHQQQRIPVLKTTSESFEKQESRQLKAQQRPLAAAAATFVSNRRGKRHPQHSPPSREEARLESSMGWWAIISLVGGLSLLFTLLLCAGLCQRGAGKADPEAQNAATQTAGDSTKPGDPPPNGDSKAPEGDHPVGDSTKPGDPPPNGDSKAPEGNHLVGEGTKPGDPPTNDDSKAPEGDHLVGVPGEDLKDQPVEPISKESWRNETSTGTALSEPAEDDKGDTEEDKGDNTSLESKATTVTSTDQEDAIDLEAMQGFLITSHMMI